MKNIPYLLISSSFSVLTILGCGGGDSGSDSPRVVDGVWEGALTKVQDTCPSSTADQIIAIGHSVTQVQGAVTLTDNGNRIYLGNVVGEDGFSVEQSETITVGNVPCEYHRHIEYNDVNQDDDNTGSVNFNLIRTCTDGVACEIEYTGTASRQTGSIATPTPIPGTTATPISQTTPVAGGCPAINPHPAAGTYGGNGGCGISDTVYRVNSTNTGSTVILEPFGSNGATSFAVSATNPAAASSARTDLTINGDTGYSCSLVCSAPGTFTVQCFKEGGTQCVEKF